jgi:hypothetical protein
LLKELFELVVDGKLLLFASFLLKAKQEPFSGRIIILDLEVHDGADEDMGQTGWQDDKSAKEC